MSYSNEVAAKTLLTEIIIIFNAYLDLDHLLNGAGIGNL
jgi:hypothetical protein